MTENQSKPPRAKAIVTMSKVTFIGSNLETRWVDEIWKHIDKWSVAALAIPTLKIVESDIYAVVASAGYQETTTIVDKEIIAMVKYLDQKLIKEQMVAIQQILDTKINEVFCISLTKVLDSPVVVVQYKGKRPPTRESADRKGDHVMPEVNKYLTEEGSVALDSPLHPQDDIPRHVLPKLLQSANPGSSTRSRSSATPLVMTPIPVPSNDTPTPEEKVKQDQRKTTKTSTPDGTEVQTRHAN
jgi:hypothetical protein